MVDVWEVVDRQDVIFRYVAKERDFVPGDFLDDIFTPRQTAAAAAKQRIYKLRCTINCNLELPADDKIRCKTEGPELLN